MNNEKLSEHIKNTRDCDERLLSLAVAKGLARAKLNEALSSEYESAPMPPPARAGVDYKKIAALAAMCAAAAALFFIVNLEPVRTAAAGFMLNNSFITQSGSEVLHGYLSNFMDTLAYFLGGN